MRREALCLASAVAVSLGLIALMPTRSGAG